MSDLLLTSSVASGETGWAALRRPRRADEQRLHDGARQWLRRLPPRQRPLRLAGEFPRVANRLAWCWHDALLTAHALDDLIVDRRGGRAGFPAAVAAELRRLREYHERSRAQALQVLEVGSAYAALPD